MSYDEDILERILFEGEPRTVQEVRNARVSPFKRMLEDFEKATRKIVKEEVNQVLESLQALRSPAIPLGDTNPETCPLDTLMQGEAMHSHYNARLVDAAKAAAMEYMQEENVRRYSNLSSAGRARIRTLAIVKVSFSSTFDIL